METWQSSADQKTYLKAGGTGLTIKTAFSQWLHSRDSETDFVDVTSDIVCCQGAISAVESELELKLAGPSDGRCLLSSYSLCIAPLLCSDSRACDVQ